MLNNLKTTIRPGFMSDEIDCDVTELWLDQVAVVGVSGEVDMLTAPRVESTIKSCLKRRPTALIIDLTNVKFLASQGMSVLIATRENAAPEIDVFVVADGPATSRPLKLVGVTELVPVYSTLTDAVAATGN